MELEWEPEKKKKNTSEHERWARLDKKIEWAEQDMSSLALNWEPFF